VNTSDLPANQLALAKTFKDLTRGRPKSLKLHLEDAEVVMADLRQRGFRVVPFPPLKSKRGKPAKKGRKGGRFKKPIA